jgi:hypothetical protein
MQLAFHKSAFRSSIDKSPGMTFAVHPPAGMAFSSQRYGSQVASTSSAVSGSTHVETMQKCVQ